MRDVRLALRFLLKKPGWTVAAVLTVAIGIAGSTLAFSLVDRALWRPLGFADGGELVTLYARSARRVLHDRLAGLRRFPGPPARTTARAPRIWRPSCAPSARSAAASSRSCTKGSSSPATSSRLLRVPPFLGRIITPSDNVTPGAHPVVVLSHMLWRTQFASDPDVLGRDVLLDGRAHEVIGVAPPGFRGPVWPSFESAFWIPAMMAGAEFGRDEYTIFEGDALPVFQTVGRVRGGLRNETLQARIDPVDDVLARERVDSPVLPRHGPGLARRRPARQLPAPVAGVSRAGRPGAAGAGADGGGGPAGGLREPGDPAPVARR